jgi:hypothetical protein
MDMMDDAAEPSPSPTQSPKSSPPLRCPRCGYELTLALRVAESRGEPAGTCSECGLAFEWSTLRDEGSDPRWFVESRPGAARLRPRILRAVSTLACCVRPFRFWSRVHMAIPIDLLGIAAFIVILALAGHLLLALRNVRTLATEGGGWAPVPGPARWVRTGSHNPLDYIGVAILPTSSVSVSDVSRWMTERGAGPADLGEAEHARRVAVAMIDDSGLLPRAWRGGRTANPDITAHSTMLRERNFNVTNRTALRRVGCVALLPLSAPVAVLLLPMSMRRARIRARHLARHLVRCIVYSLALLVPLAALFLLTRSGFGASGGLPASETLRVHALLLCAVPLTLVWNWAFVRNYLRLEHAGAVAVSNTVLGLLVALLATYSAFGWL